MLILPHSDAQLHIVRGGEILLLRDPCRVHRLMRGGVTRIFLRGRSPSPSLLGREELREERCRIRHHDGLGRGCR